MNKKLILIPIICLFSLSSYANQNKSPSGAFGINFGEKLSNLKVIEKLSLTSGKPLYKVQAPSPLKNTLEEYYVIVTPKTQEVHTIWGDTYYQRSERAKCQVNKDNIVSLLENKYGNSKPATDFNVYDDRKIEVGDVSIYATCKDLGSLLSIRYFNNSLIEKNEKEEKELLLEKTDASML